MRTFSLSHVKHPGVGGIFVDSLVSHSVRFYIPNSRQIKSAVLTSEKPVFEILAVELGPIVLINHFSLSYALIAPHHYSFKVSSSFDKFFVLANREVIVCNSSTKCSWEVGISDWFDFEDQTDMCTNKNAVDIARRHFAKGGYFKKMALEYQALVEL